MQQVDTAGTNARGLSRTIPLSIIATLLIGMALLVDGSHARSASSVEQNGGISTPRSMGSSTTARVRLALPNRGLKRLIPHRFGKKMMLAFVTNNPSDYWRIARKGTEAAQTELPDVDLEFVMPADGTAATQKQMVDDLIARGVNGIAISPVDPTNQTHWLNTVAAKTKLITQDSDAPKSNRIAYVGTDNVAAGVQCGGLIKQAIPRGGKIMLFVGKRDSQNAYDREMGIRDALKGSNIHIIDVRSDDTDYARAKANPADALVKYPHIAGLVGLWSYNGPAIISAVEDANKIGKVKIVCFDEEGATLAGVKSGAVYATVVQQPYWFGYNGVKLLARLVRGDQSGIPQGGKLFIPTLAIKKTNVDEFWAKLNEMRGR